MRRDIWRVSQTPTAGPVAGCSTLVMSTGTIVLDSTRTVVLGNHKATFTPQCDGRGLLAASYHRGQSIINLLNSQAHKDPTIFSDWQIDFSSSMVPQVYTVGIATAIIWVLFLSLMSSWSSKRPLFLKIVSLVAVVCISGISGTMIQYCRVQHSFGYTDGDQLQAEMARSLKAQIFRIIGNCMLQLAEVISVIRLFPRKREKYIIFWCGTIMAVLGQVLRLISLAAPISPADRTSSVDALIVFGYLFGIAVAILYDSCIVFYTFLKWRLVFFRLDLLPYTLICNASSFIPIVLFILDLAHLDVDSWSEFAGMVSFMLAGVSVWTWVDKVEAVEYEIRKDSVLGKEIYAEDHRIYDSESGPGSSSGGGRSSSIMVGGDKTTSGPNGTTILTSDDIYQEDSKKTNLWSQLQVKFKEWTEYRPGSASTAMTSYVVTSRRATETPELFSSSGVTPIPELENSGSGSDCAANDADRSSENHHADRQSSQESNLKSYVYPFRPQN